MIAGGQRVEAAGAVADDAGEDVEPAGRAFGVGAGADLRRQREALLQRHEIDAAALEHRAVGQVEPVQLERRDALGDGLLGAGQKARAHAIGDVAEPQVEARRLHLVGIEGRRDDGARRRAAARCSGPERCRRTSRSVMLLIGTVLRSALRLQRRR